MSFIILQHLTPWTTSPTDDIILTTLTMKDPNFVAPATTNTNTAATTTTSSGHLVPKPR